MNMSSGMVKETMFASVMRELMPSLVLKVMI